MSMNLTMIITIVLGLIAFVILFTMQSVMFWRKVRAASQPMLLSVAVAGDIKKGTPQVRPIIMDLDNSEENNQLKKILDDEKYNHYLVSGYSMLLAKIHTNDIVLVDPAQKLISSEQCPCVVVLKRDEKAVLRARQENDNAEYKLRRAWIICSITDNIEDKLKEIMSSELFLSLKEEHGDKFLSNEEMIADFKDYRMKKYKSDYPTCHNASSPYHKVLISTTLHANPNTQHPATYNKVTFSIHPLVLVQGIVQKSLRTEVIE